VITGSHRQLRWLGVAALASAIAFGIYKTPFRLPPSAPAAPTAGSVPSTPSRFRPPGSPGKPYIEITPEHELKSVQHKDASGLSPEERRETPEGTVIIHRTFDLHGRLLQEKATLNGAPVAVPRE